MITKKTVLVLGAGASVPYGFPTGKELVRKICTPIDTYTSVGPPIGVTSKQLLDINVDPDYYRHFQTVLNKAQMSVDAFLENQKKYDEVGRKAIALALLPLEKSPVLFRNTMSDEELEKLKLKRESWYQTLWEQLISSPFSLDKFKKNQLSVITFNYDRSLEHYLHQAIKSVSDPPNHEIRDALNAIPIIHVYGSLGSLAWQSNDTEISYDSSGSSYAVIRSYKNIDLIRTANPEEVSPAFQKSHKLLAEAERIFFLGFGFDQTNMRRLQLEQLPRRTVFATCLGLHLSIKRRILNLRWQGSDFPIIDRNGFYELDIYELFHNKKPLT